MIFRRGAERDEGFATSRREMVEQQLKERGIRDPRVLEVMGRVPRHRFVDPALVSRAYGDHALPIGAGQTISRTRSPPSSPRASVMIATM